MDTMTTRVLIVDDEISDAADRTVEGFHARVVQHEVEPARAARLQEALEELDFGKVLALMPET